MISVKVVDASALAAVIFGEDTAEAITERLENAHLLAPTLLDFELANICRTKLRREQSQSARFMKFFTARHRVIIKRIQVDFDELLHLAIQADLSAYDASYLWVARKHNAELVTLDQKLNTAFLSAIGR